MFAIWVIMIVVGSLSLAGLIGIKHGHGLLYPGITALALIAAGICYLCLAYLGYRWRPPLPPCKTGKCTGWEHYEHLRPEAGARRYRCECGIEYLVSADGTMSVLEEGKTTPLMRHTRFGRWRVVRAGGKQ